jgi:hypothetical protein
VPYVLAAHHERVVDTEGFVRVKSSRYSAPPEFVGRRVVVTVGEQSVTIRLGDTIIAEHTPVRAGESSTKQEHVTAFWELTKVKPTPTPQLNISASAPPEVEIRPLSRYEQLLEQAQ